MLSVVGKNNVVNFVRFIAYALKTDDYELCARAGNYAALHIIQQVGSTLPKYKPEFE
jgi:hypothetical protein